MSEKIAIVFDTCVVGAKDLSTINSLGLSIDFINFLERFEGDSTLTVDFDLFLPEVVIKEVYKQNQEKYEKKIEGMLKTIVDLPNRMAFFELDTPKFPKTFPKLKPYKEYKALILSKNINMLPISFNKTKVLNRALNKKRPFETTGKGFKDTVIWESILNFKDLKDEKYSKFIFVSENINDFTSDVLKEFTNKHPSVEFKYFESINTSKGSEGVNDYVNEFDYENIIKARLKDREYEILEECGFKESFDADWKIVKNFTSIVKTEDEDVYKIGMQLKSMLKKEPIAEDYYYDMQSNGIIKPSDFSTQIISSFSEDEKKEQEAIITDIMSQLTPKQERIIRLKYGIGMAGRVLMEEISDKLSISDEEIIHAEMLFVNKLHVLKPLKVKSVYRYLDNLHNSDERQ